MGLTLTEPELDLGKDIAGNVTFRIAQGVACAFTRRAPDKESDNEDALGLIPCGGNAAVLVVADGLGGLPSGKQASSIAVREVSRNIVANCSEQAAFREAILDGIEQANQLVMATGSGGGTTIAVVEIENRTIRPYHVGDSEILVTGQRGKIKYQSISHSPMGYAVEAGLRTARLLAAARFAVREYGRSDGVAAGPFTVLQPASEQEAVSFRLGIRF